MTYQAFLVLIIHQICNGGKADAASAAGTCPHSKDNVSWGEYQTKIRMPSGVYSPYTVVITFDDETTIGSCHSNCNDGSGHNKPICSGTKCTVTYSGSGPLEMFNIKKVGAAFEKDRSNIVSVT